MKEKEKEGIEKEKNKQENIKKESIHEFANEQLNKIEKLEEKLEDNNLLDDMTRLINSEEIEEKLKTNDDLSINTNMEETSELFTLNTANLESSLEEVFSENNEKKDIVLDIETENIKKEGDDMPRSSKKRKRTSEKRKKTKSQNIKREIKKDKKNKKDKKKISKFGIFIRISIVLVLLIILIGIAVVFAYIYGVFGNDKSLTKEDLIIKNENSMVYDRDGKLLATLVDDEKREIVTLSDMPDYLPKMYIAIEDERFYQHQGVDFKRTFGATVQYILKRGDSDYGASTLTQQLIKNITDDDERSWKRKVREITRALQVEREISKEQVLELYLNIIFVGGDNIHGVALGADYYFAKSQKDLTLAESAFLAGINHMPNAYNPFLLSVSDLNEEEAKVIDEDEEIPEKEKEKVKLEKVKEHNREKIKYRTLTVLDKIYKDLGWISEDEYNQAVEEVEKGFEFKQGQKSKSTLKYSYVTDAAIEEVIQMLMKEKEISRELAQIQLYNGGYKIYTTQHSGMQAIVEKDMKRSYYILKSRKTKDKNGKYVTSQASITIINHKNGQVYAAVGGLGSQVTMTKGDWNRTTRTLRQLGSSTKPIGVVAPALEHGGMTAATVFDDIPFGRFHNFAYNFRGYTNLRKGIEVSNNIIFLKAVQKMGVEVSAKFLESVGFQIVEEDKNIASLALGGFTYGVSTTQVAGAYAAIANGGVYIEPTFVLKVENKDGKVIMEPQQRKERVLSEQNAFILQKVTTSPITGPEGTGGFAKVPNFETAVKTGTTNDDKDRWFCGFTPKLTAAAWYGFDVAEPIRWYSYNPAGLIWRNSMRAIHSKYYKKGENFKEPKGIVKVAVCRDSGKLPTEACKKDPRGSRVYTEYFAKGTEPTEKCDHHEEVEVCKVSGLLPSEQCLEKIMKSFLKKDNNSRAADRKYKAPTKKCTKCAEIEADNEVKANEVIVLIDALPSIEDLKFPQHEVQVNTVNTKFNELTEAAQALVPEDKKEKLRKAVKKMEELRPPKPPETPETPSPEP